MNIIFIEFREMIKRIWYRHLRHLADDPHRGNFTDPDFGSKRSSAKETSAKFGSPKRKISAAARELF